MPSSAPARPTAPRPVAAALAALLVAGCHAAPVVPSGATADSLRIRQDVEFLAADRLEGRGSGTAGNDSAAVFAAARFRALGLDSLGLAGYLQPFQVRAPRAADPHSPAGPARATQNVVAFLEGSDPRLRGEYVVIGAHFDHLGRSSEGALDPDADAWRRLGRAPRIGDSVVPVAGGLVLVAYQQPAQHAAVDWLLDEAGRWSALPSDPFGESYDRSMAWDGQRLWLLSMPGAHHLRAPDGASSRLAVLEDGRWRFDAAVPYLQVKGPAGAASGGVVIPGSIWRIVPCR